MNDSDRQLALERAARHIFSLGLEDAAAQLCQANMTYGLAKLHWLQQQMRLPADACFIGSPDMTITRNSARWAAGIGYGGKLSWGDGSAPLIVLDVKPNVCGMLVGGLWDKPDTDSLARRIDSLGAAGLELDGIRLNWDFGRGNHFIEVFAVDEGGSEPHLPPFVFVMHGAAPELRGASEHGIGLYWDDSPALAALAETVQTPWGPLHLLQGGAAHDYWEFHQFAADFSLRRKLLAAERIFGEFELISNTVHQKLLNPNEVLLGCHDTSEPGLLLPFMLRPDLPGYLLRGGPNLSPSQVAALGLEERSRELHLYNRLLTANILPHGAGYLLAGLTHLKRVIEADGRRYFVMESASAGHEQVISDLHDLAGAQYRGDEVLRRTLECGLGSIATLLQPLYVFKT